MLQQNTFGDSKAAIVLAKMITPNTNLSKSIGNFLGGYNRTLNELTKIDSRIALGLGKTVFLQVSKKTEEYPPEINTFLNNVVHTIHKKFQEKLNGLKPYKFRADHPANRSKKNKTT